MPGGSTTTQDTSQKTDPWGPAQGQLKGLLGQLGGMNTSETPWQSGALKDLFNSTTGLPNFGASGSDLTNSLFNYNNDPQKGLLTSGNNSYQGMLSNYMSPEYLNPMSTPGFSDALATMKGDITNSVNDQFAAAGRDLSPGNTTALARGLSQGEGGLIADQYNRNVAAQQGAGAAGFGANTGTAGGLSSLDQARMAAQMGGLGAAGSIPGLYTAPASAALGAANQGYAQPWQNLGMLSQQLLPIASLGSSSTGTGTTTQQTSPISNMIGGLTGGLGLLGGTGAFGKDGWMPSASTIGSGLSSIGSGVGSALGGIGSGIAGGLESLAPLLMFSDERVKENIASVGMLYDGSPVYSYNYIGDEKPQIGLMAQDVEKTTPEAVVEIGGPGGLKAVHYGKATERARALGMLSHLEMAA